MPNLARIPPSPPKSGFYEGCDENHNLFLLRQVGICK